MYSYCFQNYVVDNEQKTLELSEANDVMDAKREGHVGEATNGVKDEGGGEKRGNNAKEEDIIDHLGSNVAGRRGECSDKRGSNMAAGARVYEDTVKAEIRGMCDRMNVENAERIVRDFPNCYVTVMLGTVSD